MCSLTKRLQFVVAFCIVLPVHANCVNTQLLERDYTAVGVVKNSAGQVVYEEHHAYRLDDEKGGIATVKYKSTDGSLIADKTVNFGCLPSAPDYSLTMYQSAPVSEQVEWRSEQLIVNKSGVSKSLKVDSADDLVIDAGFNNYIINNWQALNSGEKRQIDFLHVPGNRLIKLVIELVADDQPVKYSTSDNIAVFKITTYSKLLRLFADPIYLGYDKNSRQLDFYAGPTNLRGAISGLDKSRQIVINYRYN